jgi:hypothetical protein
MRGQFFSLRPCRERRAHALLLERGAARTHLLAAGVSAPTTSVTRGSSSMTCSCRSRTWRSDCVWWWRAVVSAAPRARRRAQPREWRWWRQAGPSEALCEVARGAVRPGASSPRQAVHTHAVSTRGPPQHRRPPRVTWAISRSQYCSLRARKTHSPCSRWLRTVKDPPGSAAPVMLAWRTPRTLTHERTRCAHAARTTTVGADALLLRQSPSMIRADSTRNTRARATAKTSARARTVRGSRPGRASISPCYGWGTQKASVAWRGERGICSAATSDAGPRDRSDDDSEKVVTSGRRARHAVTISDDDEKCAPARPGRAATSR